MTNTIEAGTAAATDALVQRLFTAVVGCLEVASVHIGGRLGFYRPLVDEHGMTPGELAARAGAARRYVREWLEQQAIAGFVTVDDADAEPDARRYRMPAAHRAVLVDADDLNYLTPLAGIAVDVIAPVEQLLNAYRTGVGLPFEAYGSDLVDSIAAINRPQFVNLVVDWLRCVPELDARLRATPAARIGDVAAGAAHSSIEIAKAYPMVTVDAIDVDETSVRRAHANIASAGLDGRVRAVLHDASAGLPNGPYDLITIFEALHDMNHPVDALRAARGGLAEGGSVIIADERVAERFAPPGDELERLNYGFSILHCLAVGLMDRDSAGTGTVIRPSTVRDYATGAGFTHVEVLPIEHDFWRFYRLVP
jgi:hypothetical protein